MKHIIKTSLVLIFFSVSVIIFNLSCEKESIAQTNTSYTLPKATTSSLGGVIVGSGLSVTDNGTISTQNQGIIVFKKLGDKNNEFWTSKYDGSNQIKVTIASFPQDNGILTEPNLWKISPDGKKVFIVIVNELTQKQALYVCNIDGSGLTLIVDSVDEAIVVL
jgi:hypothetical protein